MWDAAEKLIGNAVAGSFLLKRMADGFLKAETATLWLGHKSGIADPVGNQSRRVPDLELFMVANERAFPALPIKLACDQVPP